MRDIETAAGNGDFKRLGNADARKTGDFQPPFCGGTCMFKKALQEPNRFLQG